MEAIVKAVALLREYITEQGGCDHSVGICYCDARRLVEDAEIEISAIQAENCPIGQPEAEAPTANVVRYRGYTIEYRPEIQRYDRRYEVMHGLAHIGLYETTEDAKRSIDELEPQGDPA